MLLFIRKMCISYYFPLFVFTLAPIFTHNESRPLPSASRSQLNARLCCSASQIPPHSRVPLRLMKCIEIHKSYAHTRAFQFFCNPSIDCVCHPSCRVRVCIQYSVSIKFEITSWLCCFVPCVYATTNNQKKKLINYRRGFVELPHVRRDKCCGAPKKGFAQ